MEVIVYHDVGVPTPYTVDDYRLADSGLLVLRYDDGTRLAITPSAYRSAELPNRTTEFNAGRAKVE